MTPLENRAAAKLSSQLSRSGGSETSPIAKATIDTYSNRQQSAMDLAVSVVSRRYNISLTRARVVCSLAGIGGAGC